MKLLNALGFNVIWLACIFYGNTYVFISVCLLLLHMIFVKSRQKELITVAIVSLSGIFIDSILTHAGIYSFDSTVKTFVAIPFWLIILWFAFAATLNHSFSFLYRHIGLRLLVGIIFIPLSYFYGYQLNAVSFGYSVIHTIALLSLVWGISLPTIFYLLRMCLHKCQLLP